MRSHERVDPEVDGTKNVGFPNLHFYARKINVSRYPS